MRHSVALSLGGRQLVGCLHCATCRVPTLHGGMAGSRVPTFLQVSVLIGCLHCMACGMVGITSLCAY